jgi:hypothetical protein
MRCAGFGRFSALAPFFWGEKKRKKEKQKRNKRKDEISTMHHNNERQAILDANCSPTHSCSDVCT